jgi:hypothetical protein
LPPAIFQEILDISCLDIIFERPNVLVGKISGTNIFFCLSDVGYVKTTWYYNNQSEPSASDEISFEQVMDLLGDKISDDFIFNLNIFRNKHRSKYVTK